MESHAKTEPPSNPQFAIPRLLINIPPEASTEPLPPILRVPDEILRQILVCLLTSDEPVEIEYMIECWKTIRMSQHEGSADWKKVTVKLPGPFLPYGMTHGRARSPNPEDVVTIDKSLLGTPQYREKLLFDVVVKKSQKQHCFDWFAVNSTCRRLRACGRELFFSTKTFVITPNFPKPFQTGTHTNISAANMALAVSSIRQVIVPFGNPLGSASGFVTLPRYHLLPNLRSMILSIGYDVRGRAGNYKSRIAEPLHLAEFSLPEELNILLKGIGLNTEEIHVTWVVRGNDAQRQKQMDDISKLVYPHLRLLSRMKKGPVTKLSQVPLLRHQDGC